MVPSFASSKYLHFTDYIYKNEPNRGYQSSTNHTNSLWYQKSVQYITPQTHYWSSFIINDSFYAK